MIINNRLIDEIGRKKEITSKKRIAVKNRKNNRVEEKENEGSSRRQMTKSQLAL